MPPYLPRRFSSHFLLSLVFTACLDLPPTPYLSTFKHLHCIVLPYLLPYPLLCWLCHSCRCHYFLHCTNSYIFCLWDTTVEQPCPFALVSSIAFPSYLHYLLLLYCWACCTSGMVSCCLTARSAHACILDSRCWLLVCLLSCVSTCPFCGGMPAYNLLYANML